MLEHVFAVSSSPTSTLVNGSVGRTSKYQGWTFPPDGAQQPISSKSCKSFLGAGSGLKTRMLILVLIASIACLVSSSFSGVESSMRIMPDLYSFPLASHHLCKLMQPFQVLCIYIDVKGENGMLVGSQLSDGAINRRKVAPYHFLTPYYVLGTGKK